METKRINWLKLAIQALAIFVFVLILVWIFPMPGKNIDNGSNFNDNLTLFKNTAKSYYTVDRLPKNIGDASKMTLQDMIDKKIITELSTKDGKSCDVVNSYVRVTKIGEQEYQLRVELTCGNESDYILDTIGCYDVCTKNNCTCGNTNNGNNTNTPVTPSTPSTPTPVGKDNYYTLYRYQLTKIIKNTSYICDEGYVLDSDGRTCNKIVESSKISATKQYSDGKTVYMDAVKVTGETKTEYASVIVTDGRVTMSCPNGGTQEGDRCIISRGYSYDASKTTSYTAWAYSKVDAFRSPRSTTSTTKYEPLGTYDAYICTKGDCPGVVTMYKYRIYTRSLKTDYSCPNGGSHNTSDHKCYVQGKDYPVSYGREKVYTCPNGYNSKGSGASMVCYKTTKTDDKFYCSDSSYTLDPVKNICYKNQSEEFIGYTCPTGYTLKGEYCYEKSSSVKAKTWTKCITLTTYTWNSNPSLAGWIKTGETKQVKY